MKHLVLLSAVAAALGLCGCMTHAVRVEPINVAPMHVTMDVNLHVDDQRAETAAADASAATDASGGETVAPATAPASPTTRER